MTFTLAPDELADAALLQRARFGDPEAAARLWVRLWPEALRAARDLVEPAEVPGLAAEALVGTLAAVAIGTGPVDDAAAFVVAAVRELGEDDVAAPATGTAMHPDVFGSRTLGETFGTLSVEDQQLLWAADVEGRTPSDLAVALGLTTAQATVAHDEALGRLQQGYLRGHAAAATTPDCVDTHAFLGGATTAAALDPSTEIPSRTWVHLSECAVCTEAFHELAHTPVALGALLVTATDPGPIPALVIADFEIGEPDIAPALDEPLAAPVLGPALTAVDEAAEDPADPDETAAVLPAAAAAGPARRRAVSRWRRPVLIALGAAVLASVVGISVGVARQGDGPARPAADAAPSTSPSADAPTTPAAPSATPDTPGASATPTGSPTATAVATAAAAATNLAVSDPKPTATPAPKHTARPSSPSATPKPAPTTAAPSSPATSAPAAPAPTATPTKHCNVVQVLLGCRPS